MKILKLLPVLIIISLYNTKSFAVDCSEIKMDSSVNIFKKLKCKASSTGTSSASSSTETVEKKEKKEGGWKLWKKPEWMKKKN
mgnify:CR=1 FL=1